MIEIEGWRCQPSASAGVKGGARAVTGCPEVRMPTTRSLVRWLVVGRRNGLRASLRRRLGLFTWLDRARAEPSPEPASAAPSTAAPPAAGDAGAWTDLCGVDELSPDEVVEVLIGERPIAVACTAADGQPRFHALDGVCPHAGGPLGDGAVEAGQVTCPWHGWTYDLATGQSSVDPEVRVATYEVRVRDGRLQARLQPSPAARP
jgi:nitrite reductase (NADH) small subunit